MGAHGCWATLSSTRGKMRMAEPLATLRADFERQAGRSLALPIAGAVVWAGVGLAACWLSAPAATLTLLFGTGVIFPLGLALAQTLGERLISNTSQLGRLMAWSVLMVNLLWALHLSLLGGAPGYIPLSLGVGLGMHWVVFSWIIGHPLGIIHACLRTALVAASWWLAPGHQIQAVAAAVVVSYAYAIVALATRKRYTQQQTAVIVDGTQP